MKNEITYKGVRVRKEQHGIGGGRYFTYTAVIKVSGKGWFMIRETSLDRIKDAINSEFSQGAVVVDGELAKA